jgi:NDP-sugar pyrophosphorylase family protein
MTYKTTTLDTFVTLQRGFDLPAQDRIPGDIPIIAANGELSAYKHYGFWQPVDTVRDLFRLETAIVSENLPWL